MSEILWGKLGNKMIKNYKNIEPKGAEKRVFSRFECLMDLELSGERETSDATEPQDLEAIQALDLSLLGLGFERGPEMGPLPLGETVTVGIHGFQAVQAKVRWNDGPRVGVQFCGRLHDIIESWVGEVLAAQGVRVRDLIGVSTL